MLLGRRLLPIAANQKIFTRVLFLALNLRAFLFDISGEAVNHSKTEQSIFAVNKDLELFPRYS